MTKLDVTGTSAVSEPRTTVTAATNFPGFLDDTAFAAYRTDGYRRGCWRIYVRIDQHDKHGNNHCSLWKRIYLYGGRVTLTFTGLDSVNPTVISVCASGASAVLIPSTARTATARPT